jgi:DNA primase
MAILQHPDAVGVERIARFGEVRFGDESLAVVRDAIVTSVAAIENNWLPTVSEEVPEHYAMLVQQLAVAPIPQRDELMASYCVGVVTALIDRDLLRQKRELLGALQRLDKEAQAEKYGELQRELVRIEADRRTLRSE